MDQSTVFTKTAKGITQVNQRTASLSKDLMKVLKLIDGKSNFGQIMEKAELDKNQLEKALNTLTKDGFARVFQTKKEEADPFGEEDDFDFTAPGKMPAGTQRMVAGAALDISELARQHEKQDADRKAKEAAHAAASAKAKADAQARAKLEAEARARQEAERQAMEQARRAKEAAERAKAEVEAKIREEEARTKALAEQQAKLTTEQKAKEEAEGRRLAELRVKAEREAKALAEARARAEAEAAAMAKARAEAEAAARRKAEEAEKAQAEMKARLKDEIESRIRGEMEELLRNEVEEKTREEMKAQILAEARLAAKAELEERLREEREVIERAEQEARVRAEQESKKRAEEESKKRAEAEARAAAESEARIRAEEEAKRLRAQMEQESRRAAEAAAKARAEAEARAREAAEVEKRLEAERQAKYEAEARAKLEAEEREKRERELAAQIDAERKAKQEAEARARIEAKARENVEVETRARVQAEIESDLAKKAEIEGKAQAKAYMEAKAKAEQEEEQKLREEQERRAREIADVLRTRVEAHEEERAAVAPRRGGGAATIAKGALVGVVLLLAAAVGVVHVVPLKSVAAKVEKNLTEWLKDDVKIESLKFSLFPSPQIKMDNVTVGSGHDLKAASARADVGLMSLFGDKPAISSIELDNVQVTQEGVRRIPTWGSVSGKSEAGSITRIRLGGVKLDVRPNLEPFNATLTFERDGALKQALLSSTTWTLNLTPADKGFAFEGTVRNAELPVGARLPVGNGSFKGTYAGNQIVVPEFETSTMEGTVKGTLKLAWGSTVKLDTDLAVDKLNVQQVVNAFSKGASITGKLDGNFIFATEGPTLEAITASPRAQGKFKVTEGKISNVDLTAVMQSETAGQRAGGVTTFNEITGELAAGGERSSIRNLSLDGGGGGATVKALGGLEVASGGNLSGRLSIDLRSKVVQDRGNFAVSGTVSRPILKRGG